MRKKCLSVLLALAMVLTLLPATAMAEEGYSLKLSDYSNGAVTMSAKGTGGITMKAEVYKGETSVDYTGTRNWTVTYKPANGEGEYTSFPEGVCSTSTTGGRISFDLSKDTAGTITNGTYTVSVALNLSGTTKGDSSEPFEVNGTTTFTLTVLPEITGLSVEVNNGQDLTIDYAGTGKGYVMIPVKITNQDGVDVTSVCRIQPLLNSEAYSGYMIPEEYNGGYAFRYFPFANDQMGEAVLNVRAAYDAEGWYLEGDDDILFSTTDSIKITVTNQELMAAAKVTNSNGSTYYPSFAEAFANAQDGDTITLLKNAELDGSNVSNNQGALTFNKNMTLDGAGKTLSVKDGTFTVSGTSGPSMINVENGATVTLRNLTIDGENVAKHGINAYGGTVVLENVTVMNNRWYGVVCNGTQMTVTNLTTQDNQWGINVENRSGQGSQLTIQSAVISEEASIVVEKGKADYTDSTVVINGGSFQKVGVAEGAEATSFTITGGTYAMDVSAYIPAGYVCTNAGNGLYTVSLYVPPTPPTTGGNTGNTGSTNTVTNPDGSTTTTVTKPDGTVTVTNKDTQGNVTETVSKPDGTSTTTVTNTNGSSSVTTVGQTGKVEAQVSLSQSAVTAAGNEAVALPMAAVPVTDSQAMAPVVTVALPAGTASAKVEVPVANVTAGTVAVLVKADGTQEIIKTSVTTKDGVALTVENGAKVMIVDNSKDFSDVPASYWGSDAIDFATSRDLFNGTSAVTFSPDADMNRAMIVTVLARLEGVDTSAGSTWYEAGRQWAVAAGISDGSDLNSAVSREQLVTMLYRYAGSPAVSGVITGYADADSVSSWAVEAMTWAINEGIINGMGNSLAPQGEATRAQVATILMRFVASL